MVVEVHGHELPSRFVEAEGNGASESKLVHLSPQVVLGVSLERARVHFRWTGNPDQEPPAFTRTGERNRGAALVAIA
jgi:hypothetical protein